MARFGRSYPIRPLIVLAVPGASAPQTVTAQIAALTLTPLAGTITGSVITVTAQIATITLTPVAGVVTPGAVTKTAQVAALTLTATNGRVFRNAFPTTVDASGRFIKDQNGNPWMMHGDAGWDASVNLTLTEMDTYLDDRASRGVNAILVDFVEHKFTVSTAPQDIDGNVPFTGTAFQTGLTAAYWARVDSLVSKAAARGITVLAFPAYLGFGHSDEGWSTEINAASNAQMQTYGSTLGTRYASSPNLIWVMGADATPTATEKDRYDNLMIGIAAGGDTHLVASHDVRGTDGQTNFGSFTWLKINSIYSADPNTVADSATAYGRATVRPTFLIEGKYQHFTGITLAQVRREQWQAVLVGGLGGHFVGNEDVWSFGKNTGFADDASYAWATHISDTSSVNQSFMNLFIDLLGGTAWSALAPDLTDQFLTAGEGTGASQAAASFSTTLGLVYKPAATSTTVDLSKLTGISSVLVRWFDPTNGTYTAVGTFSATSQVIAHPGNNSAGDPDWVLVASDSGGQIKTAQVGLITLAAIAGTVTGGAVTKAAQVATLALTAVAQTVTAGPVTITAQVATLTLTAVPGSISGGAGSPQTVTAQIATITLTGVVGALATGGVTQTAQVAVIALTALPGIVTAGNLTKTAQIATLALTALQGSVTAGTATIQATTAQLTLTPRQGAITAGAVTFTAQVGLLTLAAIAGVVVNTGTLPPLIPPFAALINAYSSHTSSTTPRTSTVSTTPEGVT